MKRSIMSTEDFVDVSSKQDTSVVSKAKKVLQTDKFCDSLSSVRKIEYMFYKKMSSPLAGEVSLLLLLGSVIAYLSGMPIEVILTTINSILLATNLLLLSGRKIQEQKEDEEKQINLTLDYNQQKNDKIVKDYLEEILSIIKDRTNF